MARRTPAPPKNLPPNPERRASDDRRTTADRREMPPRPEGRRLNGGRREGDPEDA